VWEETGSKETPIDTIVSVLFAGKTKKGYNPNNAKKSNQDAFFMKHDPYTSSLIIGCFDGHGQYGQDVSRFCKLYMEKYLCAHPSFHCDVRAAVVETTIALESEMLAAPHIDTVFSGTTMSILILRGTTVFVANVGDSRVVLGHCADPKLTRTITGTSGTTSEEDCHTPQSHQNSPCDAPTIEQLAEGAGKDSSDAGYDAGNDAEEGSEFPLGPFRPPVTVQLSVDHKPDLPAERACIEQAGGRVKMVHTTARVYLATDDIPGLAMSRSLGDFVAHTAGVSSVPEIFEYDLSALCTSSMACGVERGGNVGGEYKQVAVRSVLLIGTDGVYDMISNEAAVELAFKYWGDPAAATEAIVSHTGKNWMARWGLADDTTLCVVNFELLSAAANSFAAAHGSDE
jgi:serine/threonine protein phosphatase PrpC